MCSNINLRTIFLILYIVGFQLGVGPIPWLIVAEITPTSHRGRIMSITAAVNGLAAVAVSLSYEQCNPKFW